MKTWNYRVLAFESKHFGKKEIYFSVQTVHYKEEKPVSYSETTDSPGGTTIEEAKEDMNNTKEAFNKPVLWGGYRFPDEYKKE